jgi:hypothetical protein
MSDELRYDGRYQLTLHAAHLNAIDTPNPNAAPFYELMSGALIWSDETTRETSVYVIWALRSLFAYRTQLMLSGSEPDNPFWDECVAKFPRWIGFLPERRTATPALLAEYRRGNVSMKWCLRRIEREMDAEKERDAS